TLRDPYSADLGFKHEPQPLSETQQQTLDDDITTIREAMEDFGIYASNNLTSATQLIEDALLKTGNTKTMSHLPLFAHAAHSHCSGDAVDTAQRVDRILKAPNFSMTIVMDQLC